MNNNPSPAVVCPILLLTALMALLAAGYVGLDWVGGVFDGRFTLVRGQPITAADGLRYYAMIVGEGLAVLALLGASGLMLKLYPVIRRQATAGADPANTGQPVDKSSD